MTSSLPARSAALLPLISVKNNASLLPCINMIDTICVIDEDAWYCSSNVLCYEEKYLRTWNVDSMLNSRALLRVDEAVWWWRTIFYHSKIRSLSTRISLIWVISRQIGPHEISYKLRHTNYTMNHHLHRRGIISEYASQSSKKKNVNCRIDNAQSSWNEGEIINEK